MQLMLNSYAEGRSCPVIAECAIDYKDYQCFGDYLDKGYLVERKMHIGLQDALVGKNKKVPGFILQVTQFDKAEELPDDMPDAWTIHEEEFKKKDEAIKNYTNWIRNIVFQWKPIGESRAALIPEGKAKFICQFCGYACKDIMKRPLPGLCICGKRFM